MNNYSYLNLLSEIKATNKSFGNLSSKNDCHLYKALQSKSAPIFCHGPAGDTSNGILDRLSIPLIRHALEIGNFPAVSYKLDFRRIPKKICQHYQNREFVPANHLNCILYLMTRMSNLTFKYRREILVQCHIAILLQQILSN